ncbi:ArnT family glycosyltransferase [Clostridium pasteurianum]|uniref:ArnT family glycosyltransferase n=1 Tax=Clostridium pasteurianum TaxID=1501 RepID=UPI00155B4027|nr:glycosyltransferase family 39 protein [Clostridium pasteurianum]
MNKIFLSITCALCIIVLIKRKNTHRDNLDSYENDFFEKYQWIIVSIALIIGFILRIIYLGSNPAGINKDEASIGYDAFSVLKYGIDRNDVSYPVYFISWGSGQNVLYAYLLMPLISLFGLTITVVRIPAMIFGTLSILIFYLLVKELNGIKPAIILLILLVINPWHIMISRWALESNLLPPFLLLGTYFLVKSFQKSVFFIFSMLIFGLSLYAYAIDYIVLPVYLSIVFVYIILNKKVRLKEFTCGILILFILAAPLILLIMVNKKLISPMKIGILSIPYMAGYRGAEVDINSVLHNLSVLIKVILKQSDGLIWNSIDGFGIFYYFAVPFLVIGLYYSLKKIILNLEVNKFDDSMVMIAWLAASIIPAALTEININRINSIFIPLIYFCGMGIYMVIKNLKKSIAIIAIIYLVSFSCFSVYYFHVYPSKIGVLFNESFDKAVDYACKETNGNIYITDSINMSYIYVLFHQKISPIEFIKTVRYDDINGKYRSPLKFGRFIFGIPDDEISKNEVYIIENSRVSDFKLKGFIVAEFKNFSVAYYEPVK